MLYALHEYAYYTASPLRLAARMARDFWGSPANPASETQFGRTLYAAADLFSNLTRRYAKPEWKLDFVEIDGQPVGVRQTTVWSSPWAQLLHFGRDPEDLRRAGRAPEAAPSVLVVAPLSGHYATLLRGTVREFLKDHEVYVTDWTNARMVPLHEGKFDFHDYVRHVREMLSHLGPNVHLVAVCQPGPAVLAAAALMAEDKDPCRPRSMTFMGSPIDARLNPTAVNRLAEDKPFSWFKSNMIHAVPPPYPGVGRRVFPGFVQLYSFMSMNEERHIDAHWDYFGDLVKGDGDSAAKHLEFYDEYLAVLDMTEEFYLQTIDIVFQDYLLPRGLLVCDGRPVRTAAVTDIALMTVEGEKDDISGVGQTQAAHVMCPNIPNAKRELYVAPKVGHYGVFNGRRFSEDIYPRVRDFIRASAAAER